METFAGLGLLGILVFVLVLGLLTLQLPLSAYAAQKWAYKNYEETKTMNKTLGEILVHL